MVDALRSAWAVLRPGGHVVDVRPVNRGRPTIVIRRGRRTVRVGAIVRAWDEDVAAATRAIRSVVREGRFTATHRARPRSTTSYRDLADVERALSSSESWRLPEATRRRIEREWRTGDTIEITRAFSVDVLKRRSS